MHDVLYLLGTTLLGALIGLTFAIITVGIVAMFNIKTSIQPNEFAIAFTVFLELWVFCTPSMNSLVKLYGACKTIF